MDEEVLPRNNPRHVVLIVDHHDMTQAQRTEQLEYLGHRGFLSKGRESGGIEIIIIDEYFVINKMRRLQNKTWISHLFV